MSNNYQLEKAHLDLLDLKTQMTVGMIAIFFLCVVNYLFSYHIGKTPIAGPFWSLVDFLFYYLSCLLTGLLALEVTRPFGNRLGATPALWAALLFCISPWKLVFDWDCDSYSRIAEVLGCLLLFALCRYLWACKGKFLPFLSMTTVTFLLGSYFFFNNLSVYNSIVDNLHLPVFVPYIFAIGIVLILLSALSRLLLRKLSWQAIAVFMALLFMVFSVGSPAVVYPLGIVLSFSFGLPLFTIEIMGFGIVIGVATAAICLTLLALPVMDKSPAKFSYWVGAMGLSGLTLVAIGLEAILISTF